MAYLAKFGLGHRDSSILGQQVGIKEDGRLTIQRVLDVQNTGKECDSIIEMKRRK
jgi:hypothetical protein